MSLDSQLKRLEQSIGTHSGGGCDRCRDEVYLPDAVSTAERCFFHALCKQCGRMCTSSFRIVYAGEENEHHNTTRPD